MKRPFVIGAVLALGLTSSVVPLFDAPAMAGGDNKACAPDANAVGFSDGLDKLVHNGVTLGGLSDIAWDKRSNSWVSSVDNHGADPARIWFWQNPAHPKVVRDPLVLKKPDGTPYDGTTSDNEGLAVLPDGDFLVSSETEPSIRVFGRDGVQKSSLPVPARFAVAPAGEATANATLEGLTITPSGKRIVAAMEGALSGDTDATLHRFLVYDLSRKGWTLTAQWAYRADPGQRIPEVTAYDNDSLLVMEASFSTTTGNAIKLYSVPTTSRAVDVSTVTDLATAPAKAILRKKLIADLVTCPSLGAPSRETQANPLLDNFEGMSVTPTKAGDIIHVISDDNFSATQFTRVLTLQSWLPNVW
jgi:hypothetical protein